MKTMRVNLKKICLPVWNRSCIAGLFLIILFASCDMIIAEQILITAAIHATVSDGPEGAEGQLDTSNGIAPPDIAEQITAELQVFPIPLSSMHAQYAYSFEDSWMASREFGGKRGHEGTDIMLTPKERGIFPVLSMSDGMVEKMGWLPQGGYRIGIRSHNGIYYYYAHLYDYAQDIEIGDEIKAGDVLGFAGDSGYSNIEGTVGKFDVHLHVGIYYDASDGRETSINPYDYLMQLKTQTRIFAF